MIKFSLFICLSFLASFALASGPCKVYGISDSPQRLSCSFPKSRVILSCVDGQYLLNKSPVKVAFHMEVESGAVPLVFKASDLVLTVFMESPIMAELKIAQSVSLGTCF